MSSEYQTSIYQLAIFGCIDGIGRRTLEKVLKYRSLRGWSWRDLWVPTADVITFLSLSTKQVKSIQNTSKEHIEDSLSKGITENYFRLIGTESEEYPPLLKEVENPPPLLYVQGAVLEWNECTTPIAIVGTRNMTAYGRCVTEKITSELVDRNVIIVSGLMYGVDSAAHLTAVRCAGKTIAVLGYGFDHCYPEEHRPVLEELLRHGATFISEYPPWKVAKKGNFPARNSIVAGMSAAVVVTEAALKSGSMITVQFAIDEGRSVCAVPGPITNPYCEGTKWLINEGATLVSSGDEVLDQIYSSIPQQKGKHMMKKAGPNRSPSLKRHSQASPLGQKILTCLAHAPAEIETIEQETGGNQQELMGELTALELLSLIERSGSHWTLI
ncbi:DNA-processing protein DprA [Candidatus Woesebacteria bacterium]|nr:DNA-processing protein DprA [Candidatus Woesebacteria bacterium]MBP9820275.1 DNA-processing protein DprA [Candidatus Woesebacteria bacterium]